jgi:dTDP-4-dehydrorhamnose reductase
MLGHKLVQLLAPEFELAFTARGDAPAIPGLPHSVRRLASPALDDGAALARLIDELRPGAVLNAVGVIKQVAAAADRAATIALNALLPCRLHDLCAARGIRLIQFGTDCVFSGSPDSRRGPDGYREADPPDARDLYGLSKLLGEPVGPGCLVLRTSIIGPELRGRHSLLEWFLGQGAGPVRGFTRALFTGLPTRELALLVGRLLRDHPDLAGTWHVAAPPIAKHDLLRLVADIYGLRTTIEPDPSYECDRRLDGGRFRAATGWRAPPWPEMIVAMRDDAQAAAAAPARGGR